MGRIGVELTYYLVVSACPVPVYRACTKPVSVCAEWLGVCFDLRCSSWVFWVYRSSD